MKPARAPATDGTKAAPQVKRPQKRTIETRRKIIAAALGVFAEKGFDTASTHEISQRAGVPQPLMLYHFGSKEALWKEVATYIFTEIERSRDEHVQDTANLSAIQLVRLEYRALFDFTIKHPALYRFMTWESRTGNERLDWVVDKQVRASMERTLPHIEAAQAEGDLPPGDPALFHYYLVSAACALPWLTPEIESVVRRTFVGDELGDSYWSFIEQTIFRTASRSEPAGASSDRR